MDKVKLEKFLQQTISEIKAGGQSENPKLELKRQWYDLKDSDSSRKQEESEFLKDLVALANTPGLEGYLVIGIDDKTGKIFHNPLANSGLQDKADLYKLVVKTVVEPVDFELYEIFIPDNQSRKMVSVLVVPPSLAKPHIIKYYRSKSDKEIENYIPVRKGTSVFPATKYDIDFMYYDRKNAEPEYALDILSYKQEINFKTCENKIIAELQLVFQNYGRKPIALVESTLLIHKSGVPFMGVDSDLEFRLNEYVEPYVQRARSNIGFRFLKVPSNQIETLRLVYVMQCGKDERKKWIGPLCNQNFRFSITAKDINNREYRTEQLTCKMPF